jgi:N-acetylglutamate synthase
MRRRPDTVRAYRDAFAERDRVYELDGLVARAWPALTVLDLDGWRVRTSAGFTRRANSVWPRAFGQRLDLDTKLDNVERHYGARGLPTAFHVSPAAQPKTLDRALARRGYRLSGDIEVCTARLDDLPRAEPSPSSGVALLDQPGPRWLETWARQSPQPPGAAELAGRILARVPAPSAYAVLHVDGREVAVARGILDGGWLGLDDVATAPSMRRRGAASLLLAVLVSWAARSGAEQAWVAVEAGNAPAVALCRALGLRRAYTYRYRTRRHP